jgi:hypothetical protein
MSPASLTGLPCGAATNVRTFRHRFVADCGCR